MVKSDQEEKKRVLEDLTKWVGEEEDKEESEMKRKSEEFKNKGNDCLRSGEIKEAIKLYESAVTVYSSKII